MLAVDRLMILAAWTRSAIKRSSAALIASMESEDRANVMLHKARFLHGGTCHFDNGLKVTTDPGCGAYSALVPVNCSAVRKLPIAFICDLYVEQGSVGVSAVTADCTIIAERITDGLGHQRLQILAPESAKVAGILIRNFAVDQRPSRLKIDSILAESRNLFSIVSLPPDRPSRILHLPLRRRSQAHPYEIGEPITAMSDLDTRATAAIVVDAWETLGPRADLNVRDKLAPTLNALRSTGMLIMHASHDREIHPLVRPLKGETKIEGEFHEVGIIANALHDAGIKNLIYMGYFSNMCVVQRSIGMIEMQKRGFNTILVRDASIAKESQESAAAEWFHNAAIHFIELNFGATTIAADIQAAACQS